MLATINIATVITGILTEKKYDYCSIEQHRKSLLTKPKQRMAGLTVAETANKQATYIFIEYIRDIKSATKT
ncbi:hypothetical protein [Photobacterium nomapromontoriensis]|uniref:hypothetical protein n=1 Tax=Photobacterium nomapromontoriensis TaxID=2910237 RepID=UPI003D0F26DA